MSASASDNLLFSARAPTFATRPIVMAQSFIICGAFFWVPGLAYYLWKKYKTSRQRAYLIAIYIISVTMPVQKNSFFSNLFLWDHLFRYFALKVKGAQFESGKQTIFGFIPHGIVPLSLGLSAYGELNKVFNNLRLITASATRLVPVFSHILRFGGSIDATAKYVDEAMKQGHSIGVSPGGIAEMYWGYPQPGCLPNEEYAVLRDRKGFVRMAIKHGANLVPVFVFGGSKLFKRVVMPKFLERVSRALRLSIILFFGKWGLPVPLQVPLLYAVGASISTFQQPNPAQEEVDFVHNIFCLELLRVFNEYKGEYGQRIEYGWSGKTLRII